MKKKPFDPEQLTRAFTEARLGLPSAVAEREGEGAARPPQVRLRQVNFNATPEFARLLYRLSKEKGGMRRWLASMMRDQGHDVPDADINPRPSQWE